MKRKLFLFSSISLFVMLVYGFWPLTSRQFEIAFDKEKIAEKQDYLNSLQTDSVKHPNVVPPCSRGFLSA